ncbi:hypothetical protein PanWU01x14_311020, partial [Parasponia andersonii]
VDNSTLFTSRQFNRKTKDKDGRWYDHCQRPRYAQDTCWKLHGRPKNFKEIIGKAGNPNITRPSQKIVQAHQTEAVENLKVRDSLDKSDIKRLQKLLKQLDSSSTNSNSILRSCSLAQAGKTSLMSEKSCLPRTWIINSCASDHMTYHFEFFHHYVPNSGTKKFNGPMELILP